MISLSLDKYLPAFVVDQLTSFMPDLYDLSTPGAIGYSPPPAYTILLWLFVLLLVSQNPDLLLDPLQALNLRRPRLID